MTYGNTEARLRVFLETYARTGTVRQACEIAGVAPHTHYRKLQADPVYRQAFEEAQEIVGQHLEDLAVERAQAGDNQLLVVLLKRFRPELYRERISTETTVTLDLADRLERARARLLEGDSVSRDDGPAV